MTTAVDADDRTMSQAEPSDSPKAASRGLAAAPWVASTYFAEGLPYSLVHQVVGQQYLTAVGLDPAALGLASLLHLPWNLKFLWSPLVDRLGTARRWQVGTLLALAAVVGLLAVAVARGDLRLVTIGLVALAVVAATNDIAIDTYYMRALDKRDQSALSGPRIGAYRAALLVGNGALVTFAGTHGFSAALAVAAGLLALLAVAHAVLLPTREERALPDPGAGRLDVVRSFLAKPQVGLALAFLLTFRAGDALMFAMNAKFLASLGLDTATRGVVNGGFGTASSIVGSMIGGLWVARRGLARGLVPIAVLQSVAILLYALLAVVKPALGVIAVVVVLEQLVAGIGTAAFVVFILRLCEGAHKATHFSFATAVMSLAATVAGSASGFLLEAVGYPAFFALAFVASLPGVVLSRLVPKS